MNTTVYFLGTRPGSVDSSLWQRTNLDPPVELLEGIERMNVTYSTSNNAIFRSAALVNANDWGRVNAVRVELVVRSIANNVVSEPQPYTYNNQTIDPSVVDPKDRHMRQVFVTTIAKRNSN